MKIIITEDKKNRAIAKWLDTYYGNLETQHSNGSRYSHYYDISGDAVSFTFNSNSRVVFLSADMSRLLVSMFGPITNDSLNNIFIPWFMERYNRRAEVVLIGHHD